MSEQTQSPKWLLPALLLLVAVTIGLIWFFRQPPQQQPDPDDPPATAGIPEQQVRRLLELRNRGIGLLENGKYEEAAAAFQKIIDELPDEAFGTRNLAIARVLAVMQLSFDDFAEKPARDAKRPRVAREAVDSAIKNESESMVPQVLSARLSNHLAEVDSADDNWGEKEIAALEKAVKLAPDTAHLWYALYQVRRFQRDEAVRKSAVDALRRAYKQQPQNLAVLVEWLKEQARARDPETVATLQSARDVVSLIAARLRKENSQYAPEKMRDDAIAGIGANQPQAWGTVVELANILGSRHATKIDRREIQPHVLEFTLFDFSEEFYKRATLPKAEAVPGIAVSLKPADGVWQLPEMQNAKVVKFVDVDLDGRDDLIVLSEKRLTVVGFSGDRWRSIAKTQLPFAATGLLAVDLDFDVTPSTPGSKPNAKKQAVPGANAAARSGPIRAMRPRSALGGAAKSAFRCATADVDFVVWGSGGLVVLRNDIDPNTGARTLNRAVQPAPFQNLKDVLAVSAADFDHDSDLDLIVSTETGMALWTNRGDMSFNDLTGFSQLPPPAFQPTAMVPIDFDRNVFIDVVLGSRDAARAGYLQNVGHGQFRFKQFDAEFVSLGHAGALEPVECDGNVSWDWVAAGPKGIALTQTRTVEHSRYRFLKSTVIDATPVDGAVLWDYDNDGYQDVLAWSKAGLHIHRGGPLGTFQKVEGLFGDGPKGVSAATVADVDRDGDLDVVVIADGKPQLFLNDGGNKNAWINVALHAQETTQFAEQRCNIHGVGSLLELKSGTMYQARIATGPETHFGLGSRKAADVIRVLWTNGIPQNLIAPQTEQSICTPQELLKGSCPYLYTWDGERYVFFTDLLWASPIGLQFADGVIAPAREWEYLKIPGDKLKPVDGEYRLQITEELWEAAYFDSVKLYAIDHPADVEIFSNEKVGPAVIANMKVHTVRKRKIPVAARDQAGRDVLPLVAERDNRFTQSYDGRLTQGLTREHFLELDLGRLKQPRKIMLYLTGWVFPSDTSINVWLSQNPHLPSPRPPSIWVPDAAGRWKNTIPYMGFPGGKTKTIAVDLSKAFLADDYRLQIRTTMELRWDAVFFTIDEEPAQYRMTELPLKHARLYYRGFSRRIEQPHHAPETYDFQTTDPVPHWPPMLGRFTRFGDVTDLVRRDDDRLVVMGAGDTMTLRFARDPAKPLDPPLPPGWKRDFFIRNVGWDKDADLNTVLGQTVEPLPYRAMSRYPFAPRDTPPDSKAYRKKLLYLVFALVAILGANSLYLAGVTLLGWLNDASYEDQFYLWMFLAHLVLGLILILPVVVFAVLHMLRTRHRKNRRAVRVGYALFAVTLTLLITGVLLVRLEGLFDLKQPAARSTVYWIHVACPLIAGWLYWLHRLAGPRIKWRIGFAYLGVVGVIVGGMMLAHTQDPRDWNAVGPKDGEKYFQPSLVRTTNGKLIPARALTMDHYCRKCHADVHAGWKQSAHHLSSFNNPAYLASVRETRHVSLMRAGNVKASRWCAGCHDPVPFFSGAFDDPNFDDVKHPTAHAGITCSVCHAVTHVNGTRGNGDYTIEEPLHYPFAYSDQPLLQWINNQLVKAKPSFHKKTFLKPLHKSAEFCSVCHKVNLPTELTQYKGFLRGQNHYDSFLLSGVSGGGVRSFYYPPKAETNCNKCHMPLRESNDFAAKDFDGSGKLKTHDHLFVGANTAIAWLKNHPVAQKAHEAFLKDSLRVDIFGLKEQGNINGRLHAPLRPEVPTLEPGKSYLLEVVLRTLRVGHHFTQGTADSNEVWLDVVMKSGDRVIGRSGGMDDLREVDRWSHFTNAFVVDRHGNRINRRNAQDIFIPLYNHQMPPGTGQTVHYGFRVPEDATGPVTVDVKLRYRKFDREYMAIVAGALTERDAPLRGHQKGKPYRNTLPIVTICSDTMQFPVKGGPKTVQNTTPKIPVWQRWNDYGIGLLLKKGGTGKSAELKQAAAAFREVEKLGRFDGPLNLARVLLEEAGEGQLDEAVLAINRAAAHDDPPAPPWTLAWFRALVLRQHGRLEEAEKNLRSFLDGRSAEMRRRGFDFRRDYIAINLLGETLIDRANRLFGEQQKTEREKLLREAIRQFQKTLTVDSENRTAHYNLKLAYALLGEEELSRRHAKLAERYKRDDNDGSEAIALARIKRALPTFVAGVGVTAAATPPRALTWSLVVMVTIGVAVVAFLFLNQETEADPVADPPAQKRAEKRALPPVRIPGLRFTDITKAAGIAFVHENGASENGEKLLPETMGGGVAFFDYDNDGDPDLLFVNSKRWDHDKRDNARPATLELYENDGTGTFKNVTAGSGLGVSLYGMGVAVGDFDNDGNVDVYISALGSNRLFRNLGKGKFQDVTAAAGVAGDPKAWSTSAGFFDCDNDGDLDLFVCNYVTWSREFDRGQNFTLDGTARAYGQPQKFPGSFSYLFRNDGNGRFTDISAKAGIQVVDSRGKPLGKSLGVCFADFDHDGFLDIVVANDTVQNFLFKNRGNGTFTEIAKIANIAYDTKGNARGAMGIDVARFRNSDELGIAIGNFSNEMSALYVSRGGQTLFTDDAISNGIGPATRQELTFGLFFLDIDLDGRLDLFASNGHLEKDIVKVQSRQSYAQPPQLLWNVGPGFATEFVPVVAPPKPYKRQNETDEAFQTRMKKHAEQVREFEKRMGDFVKPMVGRGAAFADIDRDGDLDVVVVGSGQPARLLRNDQKLGHHWLQVKLTGNKSNRDAIGATIEVHLPDGKILRQQVMPTRSYLAQVALPVTFGLGKHQRVDRIKVTWPSGATLELKDKIGIDRRIDLVEPK
eukprot:g12591.t1